MIKRSWFFVLFWMFYTSSLYSQDRGFFKFSQDSVIVEMTLSEYYEFQIFKEQPEALSIGDAMKFIPFIGDALDRLLGCKCAEDFKDELLFMFLCEEYPESSFCDKINNK